MRRLFLALSLFMALALPVLVTPATAAELTRAQVEEIVHDYIMKNPKVVIESVNEFGKTQQQAEDQKATDKVTQNLDWLTKNKNHAETGNPKGDVTIVEFFDYNCGYCKQALPDLMTLLDEDKNIRVVFVEIPILGDSSFEAGRWALASLKQKLYLEFHIALMRHKGAFDEAILSDYAKKVGLDVAKLKKDKADPELNKIMDENIKMANVLSITGTPAFVVGTTLIRGYVGLDGLRQAVADAREAAKKKK